MSEYVLMQANVNNKGYGEDLLIVENEVEEHNIFHSEVEALAPYITGDRVLFNCLFFKCSSE